MKRLIGMLFVTVVLAYCSGCASIMATSYHNNTAASKAKVFQMRQLSTGEPAVGIDWAAITPGYFSAWSASPGMMGGATAVDLAIGGAAVYFGTKGSGDSDSSGGTPTVNGNQNSTYVNSGSGDQSITINQTNP